MNKLRYQQLLFSGDGGNSPFVAGSDGGVHLPDITIAAGSASRLTFNPVTRELGVTALSITSVTVDSVSPDLTTFIASSYPTGTEFQEGDTVILAVATGGTQVYIQNGGTSGTATDFTLIETPGLTDSYIRSLFSSANAAINYNSTTGVYTFTLDPAANNMASITPAGLYVNDTRVTNLETLSGVPGDTDLGTFTGTVIPDDVTVKAALQALETALEATTYTNGLTKFGTDVELGGTLEHPTSIVQAGNSFDITNVLLDGAATTFRSGDNSFFNADGITTQYQNATDRAVQFIGDGTTIGLANPSVVTGVTDLSNTNTAVLNIIPYAVRSSVRNVATGELHQLIVEQTQGYFNGTHKVLMETSNGATALRYGFSAWSPLTNSSADHYVYDPVLNLDISLFNVRQNFANGDVKYNITDNQNYTANGFTITDTESFWFHGKTVTAGVADLAPAHYMHLTSAGIELRTVGGLIDINSEVALEDIYLPDNPASYTVLVRDTATGKMSELTTSISGVDKHQETQITGTASTLFTVTSMSSGWSTPSGYNLKVYKNGQRLAFDAALSGANTYRANSATQVEIDSILSTDIIVLEYEIS